jgi:phosphatidylglycerophosphate synthase
VPGMILAFAMSVLDSVDGKLARVTFTSSPQGNLLDHGTDLIHPPFWYFGWAWGLSGGDPFSPVFQASIWSMGIYVFDRMLERLFKVCTGRSIQDFRPIDVKLRTFVSRRNVNLAIFVVALPLGVGIEAFYAIVGWQALTAIYHFVRVLQFWDGNPDEGYSIEEGDDGFETSGDLSDFEAMN